MIPQFSILSAYCKQIVRISPGIGAVGQRLAAIRSTIAGSGGAAEMHAPPPDLAVLAMAKLWPPPPDLAVGAGDPVDHRRIWRWQLAQLGGLAALAGRWRAFAGRAAQHADPGRKAPRRPASAAGDSQIARPGRWPAPGHFTFSPRRPGGPYRRIWRCIRILGPLPPPDLAILEK